MENKTIESLLNNMVALVGDARGSLFGQDKCMVDREQLLYLVDALQTQIPEEIRQAKTIIENCNELRTNARKDAAATRKEADLVLKEAKEQASKMLDETVLVQNAKAREAEILAEAENQRAMLIAGAVEYADRIMEEAERTVEETYAALDAGLEALRAREREDKKSAMSKVTDARKALKNASKSDATGK